MKVGSLCYAVEQGLGVLAKDFYDNGVVDTFVMVEHRHRPNRPEWYPAGTLSVPVAHVGEEPYTSRIMDVLGRCDVVLFFETPFDWALIPKLRDRGVRTVLMPMYECTTFPNPYQCDAVVNPSELDQTYYPRGPFIPVPVPRNVEWRRRSTAEVFVHNAGHGGLRGRNGTAEVIEAIPYIRPEVKLIIRSQSYSNQIREQVADLRAAGRVACEVVVEGSIEYDALWHNGGIGDVFLFPERFNGLSLPLQEARAAGMLVMCGDRFPMNRWLPVDPMIPSGGHSMIQLAGNCPVIREEVFRPSDIAETVNRWYGRDISVYSESGQKWHTRYTSWDVLKPRYLEFFQEVCLS